MSSSNCAQEFMNVCEMSKSQALRKFKELADPDDVQKLVHIMDWHLSQRKNVRDSIVSNIGGKRQWYLLSLLLHSHTEFFDTSSVRTFRFEEYGDSYSLLPFVVAKDDPSSREFLKFFLTTCPPDLIYGHLSVFCSYAYETSFHIAVETGFEMFKILYEYLPFDENEKEAYFDFTDGANDNVLAYAIKNPQIFQFMLDHIRFELFNLISNVSMDQETVLDRILKSGCREIFLGFIERNPSLLKYFDEIISEYSESWIGHRSFIDLKMALLKRETMLTYDILESGAEEVIGEVPLPTLMLRVLTDESVLRQRRVF